MRNPNVYETMCLDLVIQSAEDFGPFADSSRIAASKIIHTKTIAPEDEAFVSYVLAKMDFWEFTAVTYTSAPTKGNYLPKEVVNVQDFCTQNHLLPKREQVELYASVIESAWDQYTKLNALNLPQAIKGFGGYERSNQGVAHFDRDVVNPTLLLSFLRWFCDDFCEDFLHRLRFDIVLRRHLKGPYLVELLLDADFNGHIEIYDELDGPLIDNLNYYSKHREG
jgi:hypothetical protein